MSHPSGPSASAVPDAADAPPGAVTRRPAWGLIAWAGSLIYFASLFHRRWIPMDEGTLGQAALRVMRGEMPHRDFDAMYTGLGELLHATAMALLGVSLLTPRLVLLLAVALWVPALWALARRLVQPPGAAAALVLLAVLAGPPSYPAAMPSWYNLFFATWGLWALVRWSEDARARWLLAAGACGGLSILMKVTGLYFLAAALFFVLHRTLLGPVDGEDHPAGGPPLVPLVATAAVAALLAIELLLVRSQADAPAWVNFVLPTLALGALAAARGWTLRPGRSALARLARRWGVLGAGAAVPLVAFVAWYAAAGALDALWRGVFVLPALRLDRVAIPPPGLALTAGIAVPAAILALEPRLPARARRGLAAAIALAGAVLLARLDMALFGRLFPSLVLLVPVACVAGAALLARRPALPGRDALLAVLWGAALLHLVRFPTDVPIYFHYVAPLGVLAAGGVVAAAWQDGPTFRAAPATAVLAALVGGFLVLGPNRGGLFGPLPPLPTAPLPLERARIDVPVHEAQEYAALSQMVEERARGEHILATPDVPEVYFLTGFRNPTRSLFEIFENEETRVRTTLAALDEHHVSVVVVNTRPRFSSLPPTLAEALRARYPLEARVGRFLVRWREPPTPAPSRPPGTPGPPPSR